MRLGCSAAVLAVSCLSVVHAHDNPVDAGKIISFAICALVVMGASYACYRGVCFFNQSSRHDHVSETDPLTRPLV